ncbi:MAG: GTPase, partial [Acidobacteriota bacterium]|nr:GTPase [Acidobacteriota bacterium]
MVQFRPQAREIIAKIVYYGPPLGGKTTNLRTLYKGYPADTRGELVVVPAGGDRTIFFDFLPLDAGTLRGMKLRVQLYTVPGQVHYNATRQIVLRGVDAVVFVADSQRELMRSNRDSWEDLKNNLLLQGLTLADLPHVLQYNKRDLSDILPIEELDAGINEYNAPFFEAVATVGIGVEETLQNVVKLVARSLRDRFKLG